MAWRIDEGRLLVICKFGIVGCLVLGLLKLLAGLVDEAATDGERALSDPPESENPSDAEVPQEAEMDPEKRSTLLVGEASTVIG